MQYDSQYRRIHEYKSSGFIQLYIYMTYHIEKRFCEGKKVSHKRKELTIGGIFQVAKQCLIKEHNMSLDTVIKT